jgi:hypothetical protein
MRRRERAGATESILRHHSLSFTEQIGQLAARRPSRHGFRRSMRRGARFSSRQRLHATASASKTLLFRLIALPHIPLQWTCGGGKGAPSPFTVPS